MESESFSRTVTVKSLSPGYFAVILRASSFAVSFRAMVPCVPPFPTRSFVNRIFDAGSLAQAVVAEKHTVELETRIKHAAAFNDEKMNFRYRKYTPSVWNPKVSHAP